MCAETSGLPRPFKLPSLDQLAALIEVAALMGVTVFFAKLDISNMFWPTRPLAGDRRFAIRFEVDGKVYAVCGLPFGWSHSPVIAQAVLAIYLAIARPGTVVQIQYLDDVLGVSTERTALRQHMRDVVEHLTAHNWVVSPKSVMEPDTTMDWVGKCLDGENHTIANGPRFMAASVAIWLRLATKGYDRQLLRRLLGKINWMLRPGRGAAPFLAGAYTWMLVGPATSKYTPPKVLRGLLEAMVLGFRPWKPPKLPVMGPRCWTNAARGLGAYWVGLWGDTGVRIERCPTWVYTQQAAEMYAVEVAIKAAVRMEMTHTQVIGDNMAAAWSAVKNKATALKRSQNRILRRIQHLLRWSGIQAHMLWVRSEDNPADAPSRWSQFKSGMHMALKGFMTEHMAADSDPPRYMGAVRYRA